MTRKEMIVKAMKRDAEIHARGHFTADERDTIANSTIFFTPDNKPESHWVMQVVAEFIEAPAK